MTTIKSKARKTFLRPFLFASLLEANVPASDMDWQRLIHTSHEQTSQVFYKRIQKLFKRLNLSQPNLIQVKAAFEDNDHATACAALLAYYQSNQRESTFCQPLIPASSTTVEEAELILEDTFTFQLVTGKAERHANGCLNWSSCGPKQDREWAWFLNRHYHLITLFHAYKLTGHLAYVDCLNIHLLDWILSSPSLNNTKIWAQWRGLEAAYRMLHWAPIFFGLQQVEAFTPIVRLLMLSSLVDHAWYLRYFHDWGDNWVCREMIGLATIAIGWPEFKHSQRWLAYASDRMMLSLKQQVYPDGVHKELTSHYHRIILRDMEHFVQLLASSRQQDPLSFKSGLEQMWNYLAYSMRPDGCSLLNNDSDQENHQQLVIKAAHNYQRPDWQYIASNGSIGSKPKGEASVVFPWAGQFLMRSGWDVDAQWAFFDVGPLGINYHEHQDTLHLSVAAYGRNLLVDSGRYSYVRSELWRYFRGSASHNVILIDGQGQKNQVREWQQPMKHNYRITPEFDFVRGWCDRGFRHLLGKPSHSRAVVYLRGQYWLVIDQIITDRRRTIEPLWHFHPDCTLAIQDNKVVSTDPDVGNLGILPVTDLPWNIEIIQGQRQPAQGWWSREYGHLSQSPTAVFRTRISKSTVFAWLLLPAKGQVPLAQVKSLAAPEGTIRLTVELPNQQLHEIIVQMQPSQPVQLVDGSSFQGDCAIFRSGELPLIAYGSLARADGTTIVHHE